jgi:hypothetical protein
MATHVPLACFYVTVNSHLVSLVSKPVTVVVKKHFFPVGGSTFDRGYIELNVEATFGKLPVPQ